jgi:hypothetical protein
MQDAQWFAIRSFQLMPPETLVLPDRLEQFFRRHSVFIAQGQRPAVRPPDGVEIFRRGIHAGIFWREAIQVKVANLRYTCSGTAGHGFRTCSHALKEKILNATSGEIACSMVGG